MHNGTTNAGDAANNSKDKKTQESLFGPNIGVVSSGPAWATATEKKVLTDELTPDIVNSWIEKSKDASQPTTTLQALVNLKRPTIRLSPLAEEPGNGSDAPHYQHGLEFEYDCDAPKCGIYVHVLLPKDHPDAPVTSAASPLSKLLIFETVVEGGFGRTLTLEEGALLDLGRFDNKAATTAPPNGSAASLTSPPVVAGESALSDDAQDPPILADVPSNNRHSRRRFTLGFKRWSHHRSVSGPALAVVDAEPAPTNNDVKDKDDSKEGVRVVIRLAALDEQGTELASPNEQVTYLHVVRFGEEAEEEAKPWVVKVVKREATIGPHTFHLHEIYGLSSSTSATQPASLPTLPASPESESHTYPPSTTPILLQGTTEDDPSSECLLCLSSPREVVLLPCRHLVACKDCALNMVEFGAGGNITQPTQAEVTPNGSEPTADGTPAANGTSAATTSATSPITPTNPRRKRKAKGWFCPVCRQPYSSLLRITTSSPSPILEGDKEASTSADADVEGSTSHGEARGIFGTSLLRGLSFSRNHAIDVENQAGTARVGA